MLLLSCEWDSCTYGFAGWLEDMWCVDVLLHAETLGALEIMQVYSVFSVMWQHKDKAVAGIVLEWNSVFWGSAMLCMKIVN
jgi:ribulose 1,5-bisphosphate synthetase/thiazole synthase